MRRVFFCIDGHTAGNPVRLVVAGAPFVRSVSMADKRVEYRESHDDVRTSLCFEPRGHALMSGGFIFPPTTNDTDFGIVFIETSGWLPMCGHGTIGIVTFALEHGLVRPREEGSLRVEVPAGTLDVAYAWQGNRVSFVRIRNVPSYVAREDIVVDLPGFGALTVDVAFGGNYYAIVEPQGPYTGLDALGTEALVRLSRALRERVRAQFEPVHPLDSSIRGVTHVLWADRAVSEGADARNAVFYGDSAIDRSPCGTGTSARMAHLAARGRLAVGQTFVHESYIHSRFTGRVEETLRLAEFDAIVPSIEGTAHVTGYNTIRVDEDDPFPAGFRVE